MSDAERLAWLWRVRCADAGDLAAWLRTTESGYAGARVVPTLDNFCGESDEAWCGGERLAGRCANLKFRWPVSVVTPLDQRLQMQAWKGG